MTTDKPPDVVWIIPEKGSLWAYREEQGYTSERAYVRKETLDAMTAERDSMRRGWLDEQAANDSAREALAKATELIQMLHCYLPHTPHSTNDRKATEAFLAAQPETKP